MAVTGNRVGVLVAQASLVAGLIVAVATPAHAGTVINVPGSRPTIQSGIDAASDGDTVVVAPGTYHEHIDFKGKAIEVRSSAGPATTIIDGDRTNTVVVFKSGEPRTAVLRGFTVTHGLVATEAPLSFVGGGVGITASSPTIVGNLITDNDAGGHAGAGLGVTSGAPLVQSNQISGNRTSSNGAGGGLIAGDGAEIVGNVIEDNVGGGGAGLTIFGGAPIVRDNVIRRNHSIRHPGGGLWVDGPGGLFANNLISENAADTQGGGVSWDGTGATSPPYLLNNTIIGNSAPIGSALAGFSGGARLVDNVVSGPSTGSVVWCSADAASATTFSHNDVYNGTATAFQGCTDPTGTKGNISVDPGLSASYTPHPGSPTIDAGDNTAASLPAADYFGNARVSDGDGDGAAVVDMGAVELAAKVRGDGYHPLTPARILDTRTGLGAPAAKVGPDATIAVQVTGRGGVPAGGVTAVVLNLAVTEPTSDSWLTAWPAGSRWPLAANLNYVAGQTVANQVMVKVGDGGRVNLLNSTGSTHVIADVAGWYGGDGAKYHGLTPNRVLDTRLGLGAPVAKVGPAGTLELQVTGRGGVPATGVAAVVLNVTVTGPSSDGWLTAWPSGEPRPFASNLNFGAGRTVPNLVVVRVGAGGRVDLFNSAGTTDIVADVEGWFGLDGPPGGGGFNGVDPARIVDTRTGVGAPRARLAPGATLGMRVSGAGGIPESGVTAVVLNVTVVGASSEGWLTVWPVGAEQPLASNLNYVAGQTVPNLVVVSLMSSGAVYFSASGGPVDIVVDVAGWYAG